MESAPGPKLRRFGIVLALIVAWSVFVAYSGIKPRGGAGAAPKLEPIDRPAEADFTWMLRDLDDKPVKFSEFKGRPILLNIFATWCGPCMQEMPSIAALAADPRIKAKRVAIVCVSAGESAEEVRAFAKAREYGMTILRATAIPPVFFTQGIPATFLIDSDGKIKVAEVGASKWDDPSVVNYLEAMN